MDPGTRLEFSVSGLPSRGVELAFSRRGEDRRMELLQNSGRAGSLGCPPGMYPVYRGGKYTCSDTQMSPQEKLDFVNGYLIEYFEKAGTHTHRINRKHAISLFGERSKLLRDRRVRDGIADYMANRRFATWLTEMRDAVDAARRTSDTEKSSGSDEHLASRLRTAKTNKLRNSVTGSKATRGKRNGKRKGRGKGKRQKRSRGMRT
jgi:hypothetical protein